MEENESEYKEVQWDLPQLEADEKTGPKVLDKLAVAVNAAVSKRSVKDAINTIAKKYARPENCVNLCAPRVNSEIWNAIDQHAHTQDLVLQDIQKSIAIGLVPIIQLAEQVVNPAYELDRASIKTSLTDCLSLIGHAQFYLSQRRRYILRPYLHDKYKPICNSDVPVTNELFGNDCHKRLKELGDPSKIPIGLPSHMFYQNSRNLFHGKRGLNGRRPGFRKGGRGSGRGGGRRAPHVQRGHGYSYQPPPQSNKKGPKNYQY